MKNIVQVPFELTKMFEIGIVSGVIIFCLLFGLIFLINIIKQRKSKKIMLMMGIFLLATIGLGVGTIFNFENYLNYGRYSYSEELIKKINTLEEKTEEINEIKAVSRGKNSINELFKDQKLNSNQYYGKYLSDLGNLYNVTINGEEMTVEVKETDGESKLIYREVEGNKLNGVVELPKEEYLKIVDKT